MKRLQYFALGVIAIVLCWFIYVNRASIGLGNLGRSTATRNDSGMDGGGPAHRPAKVAWQVVDRANDGFKLEMPADSKDLQVPAYNEGGGSEPVRMLFTNLEGDTT